ncbi:hypothetical protein BHE74_00012457 [Ensete ventricosum]|nr:hypothetical protein BHE74_00012457 [Ensete ventricosum]
MKVRYFPADSRKYCYTLSVKSRSRYLVRATFLYGNFDRSNVYPKFDIFLGATYWSTIVISDAATIEVQELVLLTSSSTISVCLSNASTGQPFISTLELRQFNGSLYYTIYETQFFLKLSARIDFGAVSIDSVRFPDDPFDRIWESDAKRRANYLVDVAPGTERVSTTMPIDVSSSEMPPEKVMQTAVVGQNGSLTYRLDLDGFPGNGWAFSYFAEIEELSPNETRKFKLVVPGMPAYSKPTVNVQENAQGKYRLYEPGYVQNNHLIGVIPKGLLNKNIIFNFGVILLELISGQEPISSESFGLNCRNIVAWGAIEVERGSRMGGDHTVGSQSRNSTDYSMNSNARELATPEQNVPFPEFFLRPGLR